MGWGVNEPAVFHFLPKVFAAKIEVQLLRRVSFGPRHNCVVSPLKLWAEAMGEIGAPVSVLSLHGGPHRAPCTRDPATMASCGLSLCLSTPSFRSPRTRIRCPRTCPDPGRGGSPPLCSRIAVVPWSLVMMYPLAGMRSGPPGPSRFLDHQSVPHHRKATQEERQCIRRLGRLPVLRSEDVDRGSTCVEPLPPLWSAQPVHTSIWLWTG